MQARIEFVGAAVSEADEMFEKHYRYKLEDFLRNECILDPVGVERVILQVRNIYIRTSFKIDCALMLSATMEPKFADHSAPIIEYIQTHGPGVCDSFAQSLRSLRYTMLQETCRQLAYLDEKHIKRQAH